MNQLNSLIVEGNVAAAMEVNDSVGKFVITTSRLFKNTLGTKDEEKSYFDIECYGLMAEKFRNEISKGRKVRVVGRLKQERFTDSSGKKFSRVFIVAEHIDMLPTKKQKFLVGYEETFNGHKEVEAESVEQAEDIVRGLIESDKLNPAEEYENHDVKVYLEV